MEPLAELTELLHQLEGAKQKMARFTDLPALGPHSFVDALVHEVNNAVTRAFGKTARETKKNPLETWASLSGEIGAERARNYAAQQNITNPETIRIAQEIGKIRAAIIIQQQIQRLRQGKVAAA